MIRELKYYKFLRVKFRQKSIFDISIKSKRNEYNRKILTEEVPPRTIQTPETFSVLFRPEDQVIEMVRGGRTKKREQKERERERKT